jgi:hypothetical protein
LGATFPARDPGRDAGTGTFLADAGKLVGTVGRRFRVTFAGIEFDAASARHRVGAAAAGRSRRQVSFAQQLARLHLCG